jgi:DNA-binding SARP family transcriptional activator
MRRIIDFFNGIAALGIALGLLIGVPLGLIVAVGWPLPTSTPSAELIGNHLADGDVPDLFIIKILAVIVWMTWAQLAVGLLVETAAVARGRVSRRAPILPAIQLLAAKLVTWATLMLSALAPLRPAIALPLHTLPAAQVTATLSLVPSLPTTGTTGESAVAGLSADENTAPPIAAEPYRTGPADSWWSIAENLLGDGMRWQDIRDLNIGRRMSDGTQISDRTEAVRPGWLLDVPANATPAHTDPTSATTPAHELGQTVTVEPGDHFWKLAEQQLADAWGRQPTDSEIAPYWTETVALNRPRLTPPHDPNLIYPGQQFVMPPTPRDPGIDIDLNGPEVDIAPPAPTRSEQTRPDEPADPTSTPAHATVESTPSPERTSPGTEPSQVTPESPHDRIADDGAASLQDELEEIVRPAAAVGGVALLGGLLLFSLRRLRRIQAARRRPGTVIDPPDDDAAAFEHKMRAISTGGEDVRYLAATNCYLSHQLERHSGGDLPSVIAARAGSFGVEILLDDPCEPVDGFVANDDKTSWRLHPDITAEAMEAATDGDAHPYAPGLLVVGTTEAGDLLLEFEQLGATVIEGDPGDVEAFQRGLLASAVAAPWAGECRLVSIGIDIPDAVGGRVEQPDDPAGWAQSLATEMQAVADHVDLSPYQGRVTHEDVYHPTIVVIGPGDQPSGVAHLLAPIANLAYAPLVVIAACPLNTEYRIPIAGGTATLEPFGVAFEPLAVAADELASVERLVVNAGDTQTGPPPEWTTEAEVATVDETDPANASEPEPAAISGATASADPPVVAIVEGNGSESAPAASSPAIRAEIDEIMAPRPVEVRLLGRRPTIEGLQEQSSAKLEAIIVYIAFHGEVVAQRLRDEFWSASKSRTAADTALMRVRSLLGHSADGASRIPSARGSGSYTVHEDVGCDWTRVKRLVAMARNATSADEAQLLDSVCELIEGHVAADASPDHYSWLLRDPSTYTEIETTLVDAAHRRAELALQAGDVDRANWAARKGLSVVDGQESLYRVSMQAAAEAGDTDGVRAAYREAQRAAESYGCEEEVQPETQSLYASLTHPRDVHKAEPRD